MAKIRIAETDAEIEGCLPILQVRRPKLKPNGFTIQIRKLYEKENFRFAFLEHDKAVRAVAGFRITDSPFRGKELFIEDIVIRDEDRSKSFLAEMTDWLIDYGRTRQCRRVMIDAGIQDFNRQRFFKDRGMEVTKFRMTKTVK